MQREINMIQLLAKCITDENPKNKRLTYQCNEVLKAIDKIENQINQVKNIISKTALEEAIENYKGTTL